MKKPSRLVKLVLYLGPVEVLTAAYSPIQENSHFTQHQYYTPEETRYYIFTKALTRQVGQRIGPQEHLILV